MTKRAKYGLGGIELIRTYLILRKNFRAPAVITGAQYVFNLFGVHPVAAAAPARGMAFMLNQDVKTYNFTLTLFMKYCPTVVGIVHQAGIYW